MRPHTYDAVVVGGGIVGVCTALQLQGTGRSVAVIERGVPGDQASGHNGGLFSGDCLPVAMPGVIASLPRLLADPDSALVLRWRYVPRLAPWLLRFVLVSRPRHVERIARAMRALTSRFDAYEPLVAGTGADDIAGQRGFLYLVQRRSSLHPDAITFRLRSACGIPFEVLDADGVARLRPDLAGRFEAGVWYPQAHYTKDPGALTRTLLDSFVAKGGASVRAEVTGFERSDGRIERVRTSDGVIGAGAVVIAAGPWSRTLLRQLGTDVPLDVERGYGVDLPDPGMLLEGPILLEDFHVAIGPFRSGIRLSGIDELASVSAPADMRLSERILRVAKKVFPELRTEGARQWMRMRPSLPDSLPVIGRAPRVENAFLAFGHGHKGLGTGAITGKLVQEIMDGQPTSVDITPYSPTRFSLLRMLRRPLI